MSEKTWTNATPEEWDASYDDRTENVGVGSRVRIGEYAAREDGSALSDDTVWTVYRVTSRQEKTPRTFHLISEDGAKMTAYSVEPLGLDWQILHGELHQSLLRTQTARDALASEFETFKEEVVRVASEYADQHGWCGEIDNALSEVGLERGPKTARFTFEVTVEAEDFSTAMREKIREFETNGYTDGSWVEQSFSIDVHPDSDGGSADVYEVSLTNIEVD